MGDNKIKEIKTNDVEMKDEEKGEEDKYFISLQQVIIIATLI